MLTLQAQIQLFAYPGCIQIDFMKSGHQNNTWNVIFAKADLNHIWRWVEMCFKSDSTDMSQFRRSGCPYWISMHHSRHSSLFSTDADNLRWVIVKCQPALSEIDKLLIVIYGPKHYEFPSVSAALEEFCTATWQRDYLESDPHSSTLHSSVVT